MQAVEERSDIGVVARLDLDLAEGIGSIVVSDDLPYADYETLLDQAELDGFCELEGDEAREPVVFEDGSKGVKIWLYRPGA